MLKLCTHVFVPRNVSAHKIRPVVKFRERVKTHVLPIEAANYYAGKCIILFTMFYSSINWLMYKRIREKNKKK